MNVCVYYGSMMMNGCMDVWMCGPARSVALGLSSFQPFLTLWTIERGRIRLLNHWISRSRDGGEKLGLGRGPGECDHENVGVWTTCGSLGMREKGSFTVGLEARSWGGGGGALQPLVG